MTRRTARTFTLGLVAAAAFATPATPALAAPAPAQAQAGDAAAAAYCEPNTTRIAITDKFRKIGISHVTGYSVAPGSSFTTTRTAEYNQTVSSSTTVSAGATVSASGVIASAEASVGVDLANAGSRTSGGSVSHSVTVAGSNQQRRYAVFSGHVRWHGYYERRQCNGTGQHYRVTARGTWQSYRPVAVKGAALCNQGRYAAGSMEAVACNEVGWQR